MDIYDIQQLRGCYLTGAKLDPSVFAEPDEMAVNTAMTAES